MDSQLPKRTVFKLFFGFVLLSFLPFLLRNMGNIPGTRQLSDGAFVLILFGSFLTLAHGFLKSRFFHFLFFTFLPVFTLVFYFSFVILFEHLGPVWEVVGLTLASFWSLWLIPILFPDFSGTYKKEYLKPQRFWAKTLFRYLVFPIFLLTPTGAATIGRLANKWASAFEAVFVVFIIFLFFFTFQLYIVANVWSNIGPKSLKTTRSTD